MKNAYSGGLFRKAGHRLPGGADGSHKVFFRTDDVPLLIIGYPGGDAFLDIKAPGELVQPAFGELGYVDLRLTLRKRSRGGYRAVLFARVVPQIQFAAHEEEKSVLKTDNKRPAVELKESEPRRKPADGRDKRRCKIDRQNAPEDIRGAEPAADIDELLEGERTEYFVFHFYELGYLKLHMGELVACNL